LTRPALYGFLIFLLCSPALHAQKTRYVELANPFGLQVETMPGQMAPIAGQQMGPFEILEVRPGKMQAASSGQPYQLLLVAYETGEFSLNKILAAAQLRGDTSPIIVKEPPAEKISSYAPPKEIVLPEKAPSRPGWILALAALLAVAGLLALWLKRRKNISGRVAAFSPDALQILRKTRNGWNNQSLSSQQLGDQLITSLQVFYALPVRRSTRQLKKVITLQKGMQDPGPLLQTLKKTDAWRFGKQQAPAEEGRIAIALFEKLYSSPTPQPDIPS
jgi:hypothetical protein